MGLRKHAQWFSVVVMTCVAAPASSGEMKYLEGVAATFADAVLLCEEETMTLATIENVTDYDRAIDIIQSAGEGSGNLNIGDDEDSVFKRSVYVMLNRRLMGGPLFADIWIGLVYNETSSKYYWISDGSEATYFNWYEEDDGVSEPNFPGGNRTHVILSPEYNYQFKIADDSDQLDVLCERSDFTAETTLPTSVPTSITTSSIVKASAQETSDDELGTTWIIVGSTAAGGVILLILVIAVYYCSLKKPQTGVKKRRSDEEENGGNAARGGGTVGHFDI